MEEGSVEDSTNTVVQSDATIAFANIKELKSKKKRFFVLKNVPKPLPAEGEAQKAQLPDYLLYEYKSKKHFEKGETKRTYNLCNVILLSRCTKKANKTVLGICFQDDTLYLKFANEEELGRWYFHLNEIFSSTRNCQWPELKHCFSVMLKCKDLAAAVGKHGKCDLPGNYRFCLTDSHVLLVKDSLLYPTLSLPFPCIRSCIHSKTSNFFQLSLGRLSPLGEGILHFEAGQNSMLKEIIDPLLSRLSEGGTRELDSVKTRKSRRSSKDTNGYYEGSYRLSRSDAKSLSACSYSSEASQLCDSVCKHSDYCQMSSCPSSVKHNRSQNSSMSLSTNSEFASPDSVQGAAAGSTASGEYDERLDRVSSWRYQSSCPDAASLGIEPGLAEAAPVLGLRANSIGSRPAVGRTGSYLTYSTSCQAGRDARQGLSDPNYPRPRTTSDASKHQQQYSLLRSFRPRTRSHGNKFIGASSQQQHQQHRASSGELHCVGEVGDSEDAYVVMSPSQPLSPTASSTASQSQARRQLEEEDPYWQPPGRLDSIITPPAAAT